jgi:hypothetical protein
VPIKWPLVNNKRKNKPNPNLFFKWEKLSHREESNLSLTFGVRDCIKNIKPSCMYFKVREEII